MKQIKIRKDLWDDIVSGKKRYEFRKLSKGLTSGTYEFVSIDTIKKHYTEICGCEKCETCKLEFHQTNEREIYGTAELKPLGINPKIQDSINRMYESNKNKPPEWEWYTGLDSYYTGYSGDLDIKSKDFIEANYIGKHDFVVYKISNVKEVKND